MSTLLVSNIVPPLTTNNTLNVLPRWRYPGSIIQTVTARVDTRSTWSSPTSGNGTTITDLNLTITPLYPDSTLLIQWMINGELHQDNVFLIHQDGSLITTSGYEGYNANAGNQRWSGYCSAFYDRNEDSTPSNWNIFYSCPSSNTTSRTYAPAVRGSGGSAYTFYLNRTVAGLTQDAHESMVSIGIIHEVSA